MKYKYDYAFELKVTDQTGMNAFSAKGNIEDIDDTIISMEDELKQYDEDAVSLYGDDPLDDEREVPFSQIKEDIEVEEKIEVEPKQNIIVPTQHYERRTITRGKAK